MNFRSYNHLNDFDKLVSKSHYGGSIYLAGEGNRGLSLALASLASEASGGADKTLHPKGVQEDLYI